MSVINNELTCVPLNARRRSASYVVEGVQSDSTQLNSTGRRRGVQSDSTHNSTRRPVELSWVELCRYKRGLSRHCHDIILFWLNSPMAACCSNTAAAATQNTVCVWIIIIRVQVGAGKKSFQICWSSRRLINDASAGGETTSVVSGKWNTPFLTLTAYFLRTPAMLRMNRKHHWSGSVYIVYILWCFNAVGWVTGGVSVLKHFYSSHQSVNPNF